MPIFNLHFLDCVTYKYDVCIIREVLLQSICFFSLALKKDAEMVEKCEVTTEVFVFSGAQNCGCVKMYSFDKYGLILLIIESK